LAEEQKKAPEEKGAAKKKKNIFHRIVNIFLYILLGILILLLIVVGITQTSTFREFARETAIEQVNNALNGKIDIEKIEGTILTSVILRNTTLTLEQDTIFRAAAIEVRTSPLQLLFKKIFIRKAEIRDAEIFLVSDENGELNLERLVPPSEDEDTTTSEFPFTIQVSEFSLKNVSMSMQKYDLTDSEEYYDSLFIDDFRVRNLDLSLSAFADIKNNKYEVDIAGISLNTNINSVNLKEISGKVLINQDGIVTDDILLKTNRSDVLLNISLTDYNLFDSTAEISHALLHLDVKGNKFHFGDLSAFMPSMNLFSDAISFEINTSGSMKELQIDNINIDYLETHLALTGRVTNVDDPDNMYIVAEFRNSRLNVPDLNLLMPALELPQDYNRVGMVQIDTLHYFGEPTNFKTHLFFRTGVGNIYASGDLDFRKEDIAYDLAFRTYNLDIAPFAGVSSDLNSSGKIKGIGTEPSRMNTIVDFNASGSVIEGNRLSEIRLKSDAKNSLINFDFFGRKDTTEIILTGFLDLTDEDMPSYEFKGSGNHVNIADWTGDTSLVSDINFDIDAIGESFSLEDINLFLNMNVFDTQLNGNRIDSTRAIVDLRKDDDSGDRVINIISDLADISITGNYSLDHSIQLINHEINLLSVIISQKLNDIIPVQDTIIQTTVKMAKEEAIDFEVSPADTATRIKYLIDLKDFTLATLFLGNAQLEINGEMFGDLYYTSDSLIVTFGIDLDYVKYRTIDDVMFLSNLNLDLSLSNNLEAQSFSDIASSLTLNVDRIFAGTDIRDISLNLRLEDNSSYISFSTNYDENTNVHLVGGFGFEQDKVNLVLDTLDLNYNKLNIHNKGQIQISYTEENIEFRNFNLGRNGSNIGIKGILSRGGNQDLVIRVDSLNIADVLANAFNTESQNNVNAILNLETRVTGNLETPVIKLDMAIDSVNYRGRNFGSLITDIDYAERNIDVNIRFDEIDADSEALLITGNIPMELSLGGSGESDFEPGPMNISLKANNFNLGAFGDLLPEINRLAGFFSASVDITGTTEDISPSGYIALRDVSFLAEANNLTYQAGLKITLEKDVVSLDSILIQNTSEVRDGGTISGNGRAELDGFALRSAQVSVGGRLKVLSQESRYAASPVYGDLVIATRGNIEFNMGEERTFLKVPISIRSADLTIPPTQGAYQNTNRSFVYKFVQDTVDTASIPMDFESLVDYSKN
jgi:hypothetical protein